MRIDLINLYLLDHYKKFNGLMSDHYKKIELYSLDVTVMRLLLYITSRLKTNCSSYLDSQTIELRLGYFEKNKKRFLDSINTLIDMNIISKIKPHFFMVNPAYHCVMTSDQLKMFNYDLECEQMNRNFSSFEGILNVGSNA